MRISVRSDQNSSSGQVDQTELRSGRLQGARSAGISNICLQTISLDVTSRSREENPDRQSGRGSHVGEAENSGWVRRSCVEVWRDSPAFDLATLDLPHAIVISKHP